MYRFLKKEATTSVNGIFILIVFISHLRTYMQLQPGLEWVMKGFSQLMVAMFLFYSGFGVMESIQKKGMTYVKRIPIHRVLHVLAIFIPAVLIYALLDLILGIPFTTEQFFLSLIGWLNLGNSNWYIFVILCLYLITWLAWIAADLIAKKEINRNLIGLLFTIVLSVALIFILKQCSPDYYYNTISAYLFGIFFSQNKHTILYSCGINKDGKLVGIKNIATYIIMTCLMVAITLAFRNYLRFDWNYLVFLLMTVFFCMGVVLLSHLVPFPDYVFHWCGEHLFEMYILMRIPMMVLLRVPGWEHGGLWYALSCLVITVLLAWGYHAIIGLISSIKKRMNKPSEGAAYADTRE